MKPPLDNLTFMRLTFNVAAAGDILLPPYKGSAFRGAFGWALKRVYCSSRTGDCDTCILRDDCSFNTLFNTAPTDGGEIMTKYQRVPQPFVVEPPEGRRRLFVRGDELSFSLVLIGKALDYLPFFVFAVKEMGDIGIGRGRGKYHLKSAAGENGAPASVEIYSDGDRVIRKGYHPRSIGDFDNPGENVRRLTVDFESPTRIVCGGEHIRTPEFHVVIRSLLRRIGNLSYFHCGNVRAPIDYRGLIKKAESVRLVEDGTEWHEWERYSNRTQTRMRLGGFAGTAVYEGDLGEFLPYLWMGQWVHVGKNTTFGLGKYRLSTGTIE